MNTRFKTWFRKRHSAAFRRRASAGRKTSVFVWQNMVILLLPFSHLVSPFHLHRFCWQVCTNGQEEPLANIPRIRLISALASGERPVLPQTCPPGLADIIRTCWEQDPALRPSFACVGSIERRRNAVLAARVIQAGSGKFMPSRYAASVLSPNRLRF